jgi:hypothetical protein
MLPPNTEIGYIRDGDDDEVEIIEHGQNVAPVGNGEVPFDVREAPNDGAEA